MELIDAFIYTQLRESGNIIQDGLWAFRQYWLEKKSHCMDRGRLFMRTVCHSICGNLPQMGKKILFKPPLQTQPPSQDCIYCKMDWAEEESCLLVGGVGIWNEIHSSCTQQVNGESESGWWSGHGSKPAPSRALTWLMALKPAQGCSCDHLCLI